jgi:hypothetical protein
MNRYSPIASITNGSAASPIADGNPDLFPIESIADPIRPKSSGLVKARGTTGARKAIKADGYVSTGYMGNPNGPRYVASSADSKYKYWQSPAESAGAIYSITPQTISNVTPTIIYTGNTWTNKILVAIENTYAWPTGWTVQITTDGTNWTTISTNPTIPTNGRVELYRQADGSWGTTVYRDNPTQIRGVRINVTQMSAGKVYFSLIEMGARLEQDLTPYVISYGSDFEMSDYSFVAPLGKASANTASVTIANFDNRFSNTNSSYIYNGLLDKNVEMRMDVGITSDSYTTIPKTYEYIRQFTMLTDVWNGQELDKVDLALQDHSQILQQIKPIGRVYEQMTVSEIIWRMLDSIGFTSYFVDPADASSQTVIPYYWTDGSKTAWEILEELTEQTQTAVWFDEYGILQILPRTAAYKSTISPVWNLNRSLNGTELANIISLTHTNDFEANKVTINYYETDISKEINGVIPMESVWQPDGDLVLRSTHLTMSLTTASPSLRIRPTDAKYWPYTGVIEIEGEFMRYTAKGYQYYDAAGVLQSKYISSNDDKIALDKLNPSKSFMNYFNGYLWMGLANRGLWSSVPKAHTVDASGYTPRVRKSSGTPYLWIGGFRHVPDEGVARFLPAKTHNAATWYVASRGAEGDSPITYFGTRVKFTTDKGCGGLALNLTGTGDAGYYIELYQTNNFVGYATGRNITNEIAMYCRYSNGTSSARFGPNGGKGVPYAIAKNQWYDIDVFVTYSTGQPVYNIFIDGVLRMTAATPAGMPKPATSGRWGVFTRGETGMDIEYVYASNAVEAATFDESTVYDRIKKGYVSTQLVNEWKYNTRTAYRLSGKKKVAYTQRYNQLFVDEFGAGVHEVREMDVKFEKPVMHSRLYMSNDSQAICPEYTPSAFGAKFIIANTSRLNAIVNGTDDVTFGPDNSVEQKTLIYGRTINVSDSAKQIEVSDDNAIRRRGEVELEIDSKWIQNKDSAQAIGDWIKTHWAGGMDEIEVESFMNPLLQVGDVVGVNYSPAAMTAATHKYFVVKISNSYDNGMKTTLTLRRAKI